MIEQSNPRRAAHQAFLESPRLIELSRRLNPFADEGVRIFAEVCGDNLKKFSALSLLIEAEADGRLKGVHTLVENSSGNMALALGLLSPSFGIRRVIAVMRSDIPIGKLEPLRLSRIDCRFSMESASELSGIELARQLGRKPGHLNLGQYENEANPRAYEKWLAPLIWNQTSKKVTLVAAGLGTTGTAVGLSRYLQSVTSRCSVIGVKVTSGHAVPGCRTEERLSEIAFPWRETLDAIEEADARDAFRKSRALWWDLKVMVGPSSGLACAGLLKFIAAQKQASTLDRLRNSDGEVCAVFICPDLAYAYFDKYAAHLDVVDELP